MLDQTPAFIHRIVLLAILLPPAMTMGAGTQSALPAGRLSARVRAVDFARAVKRVQVGVLGSGGGRDVLRFEVRDGRLRVAASMNLVTVSDEEPCISVGNGVAVVRAGGLHDALVAIAGDELVLEEARDGRLLLRADTFRLDLPPGQGSYLDLPQGKSQDIVVPAVALRDLLDRTAFASSTDPQHYNLSGVFLESVAGELRMVATDGHRMSIAAQPIGGTFNLGKGQILSSEAVSILRRLAQEALEDGGADARIELGWCGGVVVVHYNGMTVIARPIEGLFPDYRAVIPPPAPSARVNRMRFLEALHRIAAVAADRPIVRLTLVAGSLHVASSSSAVGAEETLPAVYTGKPATTHLNPKFAIDALQAVASDSVALAIAKPLEPVTFSASPGFTALIMPMKP